MQAVKSSRPSDVAQPVPTNASRLNQLVSFIESSDLLKSQLKTATGLRSRSSELNQKRQAYNRTRQKSNQFLMNTEGIMASRL